LKDAGHNPAHDHLYLARRVDTLEQLLIEQGRASFHVSGAGHEAIRATVAAALTPWQTPAVHGVGPCAFDHFDL
jgi:TPP-dependent pyruvate/acetoin dehydrogenase alpha subunit